MALAAFLAAGTVLTAADMPANHPPVAKPLSAEDQKFFETKVLPVLENACYNCHSKSGDKVRGGLLLDSKEAILHGGNSGPAIVPGKPAESILIQAIGYKDEDLQMPPKGKKLSAQEIADLTEWVRRGAPDPRTGVTKGSSVATYGGVGKNHWAFQPVKKPTIPEVKNAGWVKNPIDNFVLAKLEANGMTPNEQAAKTTLIRRVYFDLVGLPPTVADVRNFLNDKTPDAFAKVVDRLLASPQYGEHWARYWMDVARYSDTKGDAPRQDDNRYPHAWTYRDWVIDAFNADLPYDKFIIAQLAGDYYTTLIDKNVKKTSTAKTPAAKPSPMAKPSADDDAVQLPKVEVSADRIAHTRPMLAAQGFLTLGNQFNGRKEDIIGDQIDVTTKAFLGLTVACARCHDHKFDPIPTKDYYSLYGIFANSEQPTALPTLLADVPKTPELLDYMAKSAELQKREQLLKEGEAAYRRSKGGKAKKGSGPSVSTEQIVAMLKLDPKSARTIPQQIQQLNRTLHRDIADLETKHPGAPQRGNALYDVQAVKAGAKPKDYPVLIRGENGNKGDIVPRRFLEILSADAKNRPVWKEGSGRWQLALAIADPKNPLTARVMVNRMWQQHWGVGFVDTPDDLGNMSSTPTHPELLDYLSATFVENKWSLKQLHRMIVLSASYQQSNANNPKYAESDPNNKLLWRFNLRRMDFEELHDSLLAITGELDLTYGGKPVPISSQDFAKRRAIYTLIDRTNPPELLTQFDYPSPDVPSGRRYETLVPQQALFLMNSQMVIETARKLVDRAAFAELKTDEERVTLLYLAIYQRMPTKQEIALGLRYVKTNPGGSEVELTAELPAEKMSARDARIAAKKADMGKQKGRYNTQVGGVYDNKTPLDAWTKLAHALFQSNEAMFYN
ncbi:MAG: PSD1 and planctomycete cytochrome C domain-containing protein [Verrucomicrobiota bacterium]